MSFNEILAEAGDFGLYQKLLCFGFLYSSIVIVAFTYWSNMFMLLVGPHRCRLSQNDTWDNDISQYNNIVVEECHIGYNGTWKEQSFVVQGVDSAYDPINESENSTWTKIPCPNGWVYDFSVFYPTISTEKGWLCENSWKMYTIYSWYWVGAICGYVFFGAVSDRYGRKRSYQASLLLSLAADTSAMFVRSHTAFSVARFFSAMGQGIIPTLAFVLAMEYTGPRKRLFVLGVWSFSWTIMSAVVPVVPYFLRYWRWVLIFCIAPCALVLLLSGFVPESASWLITRGRLDEAASLIQRVSKMNGRKMDINYIKEKLKTKTNDKAQPSKTTGSSGSVQNGHHDNKVEKKEKNLTFTQALFGLVKTPNMRKKTLLLIVIWMIACTCYNGNGIEVSNLPFNLYLSYSIGAILELPANIFCLLTLDAIGRRWANFGCLILSGVLGITSGLLKADSRIVLVLALVMRSAFAAAFDITFTFSSESFPTEVRGRGIAVIRSFGGIGSSLAPFIVALSEYDPLLPLVGFGLLALFAAGGTLFVPETARQHLPHTLEEGEEFGKKQSFFLCPFSKKMNVNTHDAGLNERTQYDTFERDNPAMDTTE